MAHGGGEANIVKQRVPIAEVVREVVGELEVRPGGDLWACCPFHHEDTPSFHVRPRLGMFKCFGCGEGGDVISFVMKTRGVPFKEALELLAQRAGIELASLSPEDRRRAELARRSRSVLDAALRYFQRALFASPGNPALRYMRDRGFSDDTLKRFDIGFIPGEFLRELRSGASDAAAVDGAGFTPAFSGRVGFGIRDGNGALIAFGARRLDDAVEGPKYVNTRETTWFTKGRQLYALDKAGRTLGRTRRLVVMEGYTDVMMAHQRGLDEAVATMGTAFTLEHLRLVKARVSDLVLVFDSDEAGRAAAERTVRMVLGEGLECRVVHVPEGKDPCDWFAAHGREDFDALLEREGASGVDFLCRRGLQRLDPGRPGGREAVAREVLELTRALQDPLRRQTIVADVARACSLDRALLQRTAGAGPVPMPRQVRVTTTRAPVSALVRSQHVAVAGLAEDPGRLAVLRALADEGGLPQAGARRLLDLAAGLLAAQPDSLDVAAWLEAAAAEPELQATLEKVLFPPPGSLQPAWDEAMEHLRKALEAERSKAEFRQKLSQPDLALRVEDLRAVDSHLRRAAGHDALVAEEPPA
jgi:DNA primase catalytic core